MITVMGASGNTGGRISDGLLEQREEIRALGRSAGKLARLESSGAEVVIGDAADAAFLTGAFRGADAVYTLLPPDPQSPDLRKKWDQQGEAIVKAIRDSGVRYVVFLSSVGADLPKGTGPIAGLHAQEDRLRKLPDVNALILRPASFFENFYATLGLIKHQAINGGAVAPDLRLPMIATRDIADVAARAEGTRLDWCCCAGASRPARHHLRRSDAHYRRTARQAGSDVCTVPLCGLRLLTCADGDLGEHGRAVRGDGARFQRREDKAA
jgi:uncharacterized protein YbjT (DUF2867 family)